MNSFKEKLPVILGGIVFLAVCAVAYYILMIRTTEFYTQIDNTNVKTVDNGDYEYTLRCYDAHGKMQDFTFKANKQLREDAFLRLKVMSIRGVVNWEEVQYDELPQDVQHRYRDNTQSYLPKSAIIYTNEIGSRQEFAVPTRRTA